MEWTPGYYTGEYMEWTPGYYTGDYMEWTPAYYSGEYTEFTPGSYSGDYIKWTPGYYTGDYMEWTRVITRRIVFIVRRFGKPVRSIFSVDNSRRPRIWKKQVFRDYGL